MSFMSSYVILLEHVGSSPNEWHALDYGFIELVEVLLLSFDTLTTQD